jgi:hypothetical protein
MEARFRAVNFELPVLNPLVAGDWNSPPGCGVEFA